MVKTSKKMFVPRHITQKILGLLEEFNYVKSKVPAYKCLCYLYDKSIKKFRKRALEISVLFFSVLNQKLEKICLHPIQAILSIFQEARAEIKLIAFYPCRQQIILLVEVFNLIF